jgi:hypothetical protein
VVSEIRSWGGFSGIETDFERNQGKKTEAKAGRFSLGIRKESETSGQKNREACQLYGFKESLRRFNLQTDWASFPCAVVSMTSAYQDLTKQGRKTYADCRNEKQHFPFWA